MSIYGKIMLCEFDVREDALCLTDELNITEDNRVNFSAYVKLRYTQDEVGKKIYMLLLRILKDDDKKQYNSAMLKEYILLGEKNEGEQSEFKRNQAKSARIGMDSLDHVMESKYNVKNFSTLGSGEYALVLKSEEQEGEERRIHNSSSILDIEYFIIK